MITYQQAMDVMDSPAIADLDTSVMETDDIVNLILQRSEILKDQRRPGRFIKQWTQGEDAPMLDIIDQIGEDTLVRRAAAFIYLEYLELKPVFEQMAPNKIADIGCGYALFDLFLAKEFGSDLVLIDLESNERRHFGFKEEGAAYSSLAHARALLTANGVKDSAITTLNPEQEDPLSIKDLDYAFSFISCGFHYPWSTYRAFFQQSVKPEGRVILDIRAAVLGEAMVEMSQMAYLRTLELAANNSAHRIEMRKTL